MIKYIAPIIILAVLTSCASSNIEKLSDKNRAEKSVKQKKRENNEDLARDHFIKANSLEQQMKYAEAVIELQIALKYDSSKAISNSVAENLSRMKQFELAEDFVDLTLAMDSNYAPALELLAQMRIQNYKFDEARQILEKLIKIDPTSDRKEFLARLYKFSDKQRAMELFEEVVEDSPGNMFVLRELIDLYESENQYDKLLMTLVKIHNLDPGNVNSIMRLSSYYAENKEYGKAIELLRKSRSAAPIDELDEAYGVVAYSLFSDTSSIADKFAGDFIELLGDNFYLDWRLMIFAGSLSARTGDSSRAETYYERALKTGDEFPSAPLQAGFFYMQRTKYDKAVDIFSKYESEFPKDSRFPFFIGMANISRKKYSESIPHLKKALAMDSSNIDIYGNIGLAYENLKMYDSSFYFYELGLKVDSLNPLLNNNYAYSLSERGVELERAKKMSKLALGTDSTNAAYLDTYGWILFKLGDFDGAIKYIQKAIDTGDASAEVYEHLGDVLAQKGESRKAQEAYRKSIEMDSSRQTAKDKLKQIK